MHFHDRENEKINFLLSVTIIQARNLNILNAADTCVVLNFNRRIKSTNIQLNSDCPFYNENFTFEFKSKKNEMLKKTLQISVYQVKGNLKSDKLIGGINLSLNIIWIRQCECDMIYDADEL